MHLDYILFAVSAGLIIFSVLLFTLLFCSRRKGTDYRRVIQEETQRIDVVSTLQNTQRLTASSQPLDAATELLCSESEAVTEFVFDAEIPDSDLTARLIEYDSIPTPAVGDGLDLSLLEGKYELIQEIHRGGMSRVFLAHHKGIFKIRERTLPDPPPRWLCGSSLSCVPQ